MVTQIDGAPLGALSALEVGADGKVYFAMVGQESAEHGLESALRTELLAHTGTGAVYVYDPAARTVEQGVVERIRQRGARPAENGTHPGSAAVTGADVNRMTRSQREALERQALHGAKISF